MTVREARGKDIDAIREVAKASWEHDYPEILSRETVAEGFDEWYGHEMLESAVQNPKTIVHVATDGGTIQGFGHALVDGDTGIILRLYVHPDHRREGVGTELCAALIDTLSAFDPRRIEAMVLAENSLGNEFYRARGFEKRDERVTTIGGEEFAENTYTRHSP